MIFDSRYIPGSFRSQPRGVEFDFRPMAGGMLYIVHSMWALIDGKKIPGSAIRMTKDGHTVPASKLVTTDWVCLRGEQVTVSIDLAAPLAPGEHEIDLKAIYGGRYAGRSGGGSRSICRFTIQVD